MSKGKDVYDIGKEDGRKEREAEIIEILKKLIKKKWICKSCAYEIAEQIKEQK